MGGMKEEVYTCRLIHLTSLKEVARCVQTSSTFALLAPLPLHNLKMKNHEAQ